MATVVKEPVTVVEDEGAPAAGVENLNLYQRINAIQRELGKLEKTGKNKDLKFDFIEYAVVAAKLKTLFARHGIVFLPSITDTKYVSWDRNNGTTSRVCLVDMSFTIVNADKPDERETCPWQGEASATDDKSVSKAKTSGLKNWFMSLLMLSDKDDPDALSDPGDAEEREIEQGKRPPTPIQQRPPLRSVQTQTPETAQAAALVEALSALRSDVNAGLEADKDARAKLPKTVDDMNKEELEKTLAWLRNRAKRQA